MVRIKNFDENIEKSLGKLEKQIEEERASYETEAPPEREIVKRSVQSLSRDLPEEDASPAVVGEEVKPEDSVLPDYLQKEDGSERAKREVEGLVGLVFEKGLEKALKDAKKQPPFIEDAFHDALTDKLLPELKKRGIVK